MKLRVRFFSSLYISLLCASVSSSVLATQTEAPERWFEVEVILFKQISDKKVLKEQFPDRVSSTNLPQYKKYFDLLTPYLQPNLTRIKQFTPRCDENEVQHTFIDSLPRIKTPFPDAIKAIEHIDSFKMSEFTTENKAVDQQGAQKTDITANDAELETVIIKNDAQKTPESILENNDDSLTIAQHRELAFNLQKELASPLFSTQNICVISRKDIENLFTDEQLANFQLNAFDIETLPVQLNASGVHISDNPYLIANESLLLADIKQRLQWSKEFKPLLHLGWRQIGVTRDKAIPIKLFAGKHLDYQYQQASNEHQSALDAAKQAEQLILQQLAFQQSGNVEQQEIDGSTAQIEQNKNNYAEIKQQQLMQVFNELETIDSVNINNLIGDLERQEFEELIAINESNIDENKPFTISKPPVEPLQPWFLDGVFKVHLDHYLYITADFNILDQSLDKSTSNTTNKTRVKLINFSQNKRAITGEIHYFDHPYIGMIVQIRRFDPSKPKEEAVTQVIN
ncbi:CsiV family protein [Candidatus Colwellia aromaticivorans]|uniref:CsiV family protein n=1 Tax=Candidatus Colwellia aromaticivorans TaxID=2267621 RepID=UPI000DF14146|nr:CsiV family protein [Candidatus Colwellia aromaticivorans]